MNLGTYKRTGQGQSEIDDASVRNHLWSDGQHMINPDWFSAHNIQPSQLFYSRVDHLLDLVFLGDICGNYGSLSSKAFSSTASTVVAFV